MNHVDDSEDDAFDAWLDSLRVDIVQGEYGYEPGEMTIYADLWRSAYVEGLTPRQAFDRALHAAELAREARFRAQKTKYW